MHVVAFVVWVLVVATAGVLTGAQVGYYIGARGGRVLLERTQRPKPRERTAASRQSSERCGPVRR
jgi:membrane protein DedA with SNARE-associated domain